jgi:uncharacterized coiled-coil protein SlyX
MSTPPDPPTPSPFSPPEDDRLTRLEEHAGFTEHTVEQLSAEIRMLNARVHELSKRLESLEGRLGGVVERVEKVEDRTPPT